MFPYLRSPQNILNRNVNQQVIKMMPDENIITLGNETGFDPINKKYDLEIFKEAVSRSYYNENSDFYYTSKNPQTLFEIFFASCFGKSPDWIEIWNRSPPALLDKSNMILKKKALENILFIPSIINS